MNIPPSLDEILADWDYDPAALSVRMVKGKDDRDLIQMRIELGILQLETTGRPDGHRPFDCDTIYDYLLTLEKTEPTDFTLSEEQCVACDREFVQFYHRRICWLAMEEYANAVKDAEHSLRLMDLCVRHSSDEQWVLSHEQYRPFVMYHRIQAHAMSRLSKDDPEEAIESINKGLEELQQVYVQHDLEEEFEDDELVSRLVEFRESLRAQFEVGRTLREQLADAVATEEYELAARLRDQLEKKLRPPL